MIPLPYVAIEVSKATLQVQAGFPKSKSIAKAVGA